MSNIGLVLLIGLVPIGIIAWMQWKRIYPFGVRNEDMIDHVKVELEGLRVLREKQEREDRIWLELNR